MKILKNTKILTVLAICFVIAMSAKPGFCQNKPAGSASAQQEIDPLQPAKTWDDAGMPSNPKGNSRSTIDPLQPAKSWDDSDSSIVPNLDDDPYEGPNDSSGSSEWEQWMPAGPDSGDGWIWVLNMGDGTKVYILVVDGGDPNKNPEDILGIWGPGDGQGNDNGGSSGSDSGSSGSGDNSGTGSGGDNSGGTGSGDSGSGASGDNSDNGNNGDSGSGDNGNGSGDSGSGGCQGGDCGGEKAGYIEKGDPCPFCNTMGSHAYIEKGDPVLNNQRGNPGDKSSFRIPGNPGDPVTSGQNQLNNPGSSVSFGIPHNPGDPEPKGRVFGAGMR